MATKPAEQNFQPQTRDTTNGPINHTYVPRSDGAYMIGDTAYYLQPGGTLATMPVAIDPNAGPPLGAAPAPMKPLGSGFPTLPPQVIYQQPQPAYYANGLHPYAIVQPSVVHGGMPALAQPTYGTLGYTGLETLNNQMTFAQNSNLNEKQEMKPSDDDPMRMYWVREEDNTWTQRNRMTIDSGDIGECRWYAMDGKFYAVRLAK